MEPSDGFHLSTQDSAMALPGIANENEFYSAHYLDAILTERFRSRCRSGGRRRPPSKMVMAMVMRTAPLVNRRIAP